MAPEIRLHNPALEAKPAETGEIGVFDVSAEQLLDIGFIDAPTLHSESLRKILAVVLARLHMTWDSNAQFWDPIENSIGGAVWVSNIWQNVE